MERLRNPTQETSPAFLDHHKENQDANNGFRPRSLRNLFKDPLDENGVDHKWQDTLEEWEDEYPD